MGGKHAQLWVHRGYRRWCKSRGPAVHRILLHTLHTIPAARVSHHTQYTGALPHLPAAIAVPYQGTFLRLWQCNEMSGAACCYSYTLPTELLASSAAEPFMEDHASGPESVNSCMAGSR